MPKGSPMTENDYLRNTEFPSRIGLVSLDSAAYMLDVALSTVRKWRRTGRLPAKCWVHVSPRKYMYVEDELAKVINDGEIYKTSYRG